MGFLSNTVKAGVTMGVLASMAFAGTAAAGPHAAGDLDGTFGTGGQILTEMGSKFDEAHAVVIQPDGKIVVAGGGGAGTGDYTAFGVARYNANGSLDAGFGTGGKATVVFDGQNYEDTARAVALQADGKIVVGGSAYSTDQRHQIFAVTRLTADGQVDTSFGTGGKVQTAISEVSYLNSDEINAIAVDANGKILVAGSTGQYIINDFAVARYNADGSLDSSFGTGGIVVTDSGVGEDVARGIALQPDGKILVAGNMSGGGGNDNFGVVRYNPDGSLDTSFGNGGMTNTDFLGGTDWPAGVALLPGGKIVVGGFGEMQAPCYQCHKYGPALVQYNADGSLDTTFGSAGQVHTDFIYSVSPYAFARMSNGKLALGGRDGNDFAVAVYNADGSVDSTFGDGGLAEATDGGSAWVYGLAFQADGKIVAVGKGGADYDNGQFTLARFLHSAVAPPTPTSTAVPTNTPQPTSTPGGPPPTATVPPGGVTYSDVPPGSPFYSFVTCLANRGIIAGYADGTFRPGNPVTRGQLAKIVSNAAGYSEPVTGQTFSDVPPGSPFYEFVERMARRGVIGGYADGTFRPGANATRGQISKIVSNAAGLNDAVTGQTFSDVPASNPFYPFIERMAAHGIIGGYADGTFRPSANATRGQVAKIGANAFFPNCQQ
jgi:uncharacterized delta-60 repeat protein